MLIRSFNLCIAFLALSLTIFAQNSVEQPKAVLLDEFGALEISDIMARLDAVAVQFQNDPSATLTIICYRDEYQPKGIMIRNFKMMENYLNRNRGIDSLRLNFIDGSEVKEGFRFQLWLLPAGAESPALLKPIGDSLKNTKIARKFDEYYYAFDDLEYNYWDGDAVKEFVEIIKKEPNSIAYVILYPEYNSYGGENDKPVISKDSLRKINRAKADISKNLRKAGLPLSRIKIVNGGYRDNRFIELWILPKGVEPPAATPNAFPKTQRKSGK